MANVLKTVKLSFDNVINGHACRKIIIHSGNGTSKQPDRRISRLRG